MKRRTFESMMLAVGLLVGIATTGQGAVTLVNAESDRENLQAILDSAVPGDVIELGPGRYDGPIRIEKRLTLRGRGGVIHGGGVGTPLVVVAPGVRIEGLVVQGSGEDVGAPDTCIYLVASATGAVVRGNTLRDCAFGIWVHETDGAQIENNRIWGRKGVRVSDRGNGIHLFNASNLAVIDNEVYDVRDGIYVSATENSLIEGNLAERVRFGVHYMYSYDNVLRDNVMSHNTLGIALMESHNLIVEGNRAFGNRREGLLFRDLRNSEIRRNLLERNGNGMFFYSSTGNVIEDNLLLENEIGLKIWAGTRRNRMEGNVIRGNREQVFYVGAEDQVWGESGRGNYWGDYLGWDQDGDGIGDRPHRVDSFTAGLLYRYPSATLLLRSPALEILSHMADRLPMLRTPTIVDRSPLLAEPKS
jgi:nitrous oxidase accessory protein